MYVTRLTVGSSPARAQLVDEHPVCGGWLKDQISRLKKGCKNLMTRFSMYTFKPALLKKMRGA